MRGIINPLAKVGSYRREWLVQLLNAERPRLGPLPIPHARCREQPKNLYRSLVSSSTRAKTGYKCQLRSRPCSSTRMQVNPLSEVMSRTLRIDPIHRWTKTRRASESELRRVGTVSYTHLRAHETKANLVCRLLLEKKMQAILPWSES